MTAEQRRQAVVEAAVGEFARRGYAGAPTETIARRAGISQPYLFRLFRSKKELFLAAVEHAFAGLEARCAGAAEGLEGQAALEAMRRACTGLSAGLTGGLSAEPQLLLLQSYVAAASDDEIGAFTRARLQHLSAVVSRLSGAGADSLRSLVAAGMLCAVAAAIELPELGDLEAVRRA